MFIVTRRTVPLFNVCVVSVPNPVEEVRSQGNKVASLGLDGVMAAECTSPWKRASESNCALKNNMVAIN